MPRAAPVRNAANTKALLRAEPVTEGRALTVSSAAPSGESIDSAVCELNEILRSGTVDLHIRMGRAIIARLYGGDLGRWRARGPREISFRRLASRATSDLMVSASSLCKAVALYELTDRVGISTWKHLSVSHLRGVLGLAHHQQRQLLATAESQMWTVARLENEKAKLCEKGGQRRGRRPLPPFVKTVRRLSKLLADPHRSLAGLEHLSRVTEQEVTRLRAVVARTRERLEALEAQLGARNGRRNDSNP